MDDQLRRFAARLYDESHAHDQARTDRLERFRNVEPPTAELLGVLIRAVGARGILELGTSNGYSTIWLADAARATRGRVVSLDVDSARTELARETLRGVGLSEIVELRVGDARDLLADSVEGEWEFIFLDASARPTPAMWATWFVSWRREGCWPSTTCCHTSTSSSSSRR